MSTIPCTCGKKYQWDSAYAGRRIKCRYCGAVLTVPECDPASSVTAAPASTPRALDVTAAASGSRILDGQDFGEIAGPASVDEHQLDPTRDTPGTAPTEDLSAHHVHAAQTNPSSAHNKHGPYTIVRTHAQGGMGKVSIARDERLKREVALKEMLQKVADNPTLCRRFVDEAEITGQLEHPGIVPVYALGTDRHGRPFYTMRLVRGKTLKEAIAQVHDAWTDRELRALLRSFVAICQTIAFAHARGVVHRDLKPANVMLGEYGETLVMDWGLARPLEPSSPDSTWGDLAVRAADRPQLTQAGGLVGTPAYMPPEQVTGDSQAIEPAIDIYSLGAVLYEILCGRAAYTGGSSAEVLQKVRTSAPVKPSAADPRVARPLEAICLTAMARKPDERYRSVRTLATDVQNWLDDDPVSVYRESPPERMFRWGRKHRTLVASIAVLSVVLGLAIAISGWLWLVSGPRRSPPRSWPTIMRRDAAEAEAKARDKESQAAAVALQAAAARREAAEAIRKAAEAESQVGEAKALVVQLEQGPGGQDRSGGGSRQETPRGPGPAGGCRGDGQASTRECVGRDRSCPVPGAGGYGAQGRGPKLRASGGATACLGRRDTETRRSSGTSVTRRGLHRTTARRLRCGGRRPCGECARVRYVPGPSGQAIVASRYTQRVGRVCDLSQEAVTRTGISRKSKRSVSPST